MRGSNKVEKYSGNKENSVSADQVINDIYKKRRSISIEEFIEFAGGSADKIAETYPERVLFQYGNKILILGIDREKKAVSTIIKAVGGDKKENETTFLYRTAKRLMQETANAERTPLQYKARTYNETMMEWAKTSGNDVFAWEEQRAVADALICKSTIKPQTQ